MANDDLLKTLTRKIKELYHREMGELSLEERKRRLVKMNWHVGQFIVEEEQQGEQRAPYRRKLIPNLSDNLTRELGSGFSRRSLESSRQFYKEYQISQISAKLSWSHYMELLSLRDKAFRDSLEKKAIAENLPHGEMRRLVKQHNIEYDLLHSERKPLVSRKPLFNICKVVTLPREEKTVTALDLGFETLEYLTNRQAQQFAPGCYVVFKNTKTGKKLLPKECNRGARYCFNGFLNKVVDGDTLKIEIELANGKGLLQRFRLRGVLAKELGSKKGEQCKRFVKRRIKPGAPLTVFTYGKDNYGRYVADVHFNNRFLNMEIINAKLG